MDTDMRQRNKELSQKKKRLTEIQSRIQELDKMFQRIYEDNISGKLSDERFRKLSKGYEEEQHTLQKEQTSLEKELQKEEKQMCIRDSPLTVRDWCSGAMARQESPCHGQHRNSTM